MWNFIYEKLEKYATWKIAGVLIILFILCSLGFELRKCKIGMEMFDSCWFIKPSAECWYNPQQASNKLSEIGSNGRHIYAVTQLTLDFLFPFVYGGLSMITMFALYGRKRYTVLMPLIMIIIDFLENITTAYLAGSYQEGVESPLTWFATSFTAGKSIAMCLVIILIFIGVLLFFIRRLK